MHAEAGAIEVVGGVEGRRATPPGEFQMDTGSTGNPPTSPTPSTTHTHTHTLPPPSECCVKRMNSHQTYFAATDAAGIAGA